MPEKLFHTSKEPPVREALLHVRVSTLHPVCATLLATRLLNTKATLALTWEKASVTAGLSLYPLALKHYAFTAF